MEWPLNIFFPTLAIFTKRDGEGGIRIFAAQLPMSVVKQLKKPCQSAAVRPKDWRGDLEQSGARWGSGTLKRTKDVRRAYAGRMKGYDRLFCAACYTGNARLALKTFRNSAATPAASAKVTMKRPR